MKDDNFSKISFKIFVYCSTRGWLVWFTKFLTRYGFAKVSALCFNKRVFVSSTLVNVQQIFRSTICGLVPTICLSLSICSSLAHLLRLIIVLKEWVLNAYFTWFLFKKVFNSVLGWSISELPKFISVCRCSYSSMDWWIVME